MPTTIVNFKQGEDVKITVSVTETPAINFSLATSIKAILKVNNIEQKRYSLNTITNYGDLAVNPTNNNEIDIFVERAESQNFPTGSVTIDLVAALPNITFPDGNQIREWNFNVGRCTVGAAKDETMP